MLGWKPSLLSACLHGDGRIASRQAMAAAALPSANVGPWRSRMMPSARRSPWPSSVAC
jgi:hypothetical protein